MKNTLLITLLFCLTVVASGAAETLDKETVMVPMRDGVRLATDIYRPNNEQPHPVILYRTPYNKDTDGFDDNVIKVLNALGYIYVAQDCRGRFHSEGVDSVFITDGWGYLQDGYDTIEWIVQQSWCNGKVGMLGGSATGITTLRAAGALHPNLVCAAVLVAASDFYHQVVYPGGEFRKSICENWIHSQRSDYMISFFLQFPYYDHLWEQMNLHTRTSMMTVPILHIGGWYDCFSDGTVMAFRDLNSQPNAGPQRLIMGPWVHGEPSTRKVGELRYPNAGFDWESLLMLWLDYWLRGNPNPVLNTPNVSYYLMGDPDRSDEMGCEWLDADTWPPENRVEKNLYLAPDGLLSESAPGAARERSYQYDPQHPVPTLGGNNLTIANGPYDQRTIGERDDILSFQTPVLTTPVRVEGFVHGHLYASSDCQDTDFTLKLLDVYPDGREMLVTDGIRRARFRNGYRQGDVKLLRPGEMVSINIQLPPTAIVFNSGHRVKVQISSSNYPRYEINPNTGNEPNDRSNPLIATNTIYLGGDHASYITLPVVPIQAGVAADGTPPGTFRVFANYPNPFNTATSILYELPAPVRVTVDIFNVNGQRIITLVDAVQNMGLHRLVWDGKDAYGQPVPSGVYLYRIVAGGIMKTQKMLMVK